MKTLNNIEPCPFCSSSDVDKREVEKEVVFGWGDGMGSPGSHHIKEVMFECKRCHRQWKGR